MKTNLARWLRGALLAASCLVLVGSRAETPPSWNGSASKGFIVSVLQREDAIFASTDIGVYRAALSDKVWHKLPLPVLARMWGFLAREAAPSPHLIYYTGHHSIVDVDQSTAGEFYVSSDLGLSWERTSTGHNFTDVFIQANGDIYANELMLTPDPPPHSDGSSSGSTTSDTMGHTRHIWYHVMVSHDLGRNWVDISEGLSPAYSYFILQDLDHPERIRLVGSEDYHALRERFYEATDQEYHWKEVPRKLWRKDPGGKEDIFGSLTPGSNNSDARADLSTLLEYTFLKWGNSLDIQAVQIETGKPAYTFRQHEPMPVTLEAHFVFSRKPLQFADNEDETICWGLRGYPENGDPFYAPAKANALHAGAAPDKARLATSLTDRGARIVTLDNEHPYRRTIDLAKIYDFPGPGKYRVQPAKSYCPFFKGDAGFTGQVIDVTITP